MTTSPPPSTTLDKQPPRLLSAFFGLDNALPPGTLGMCRQAAGADGMPVTFSRRVNEVRADAFTVITGSGARKTPSCATLAPADEVAERHTVLLVGDLGDASTDPPERVEVTGSLPLAGGADARGLEVEVTPLEEGPTLVLAFALPADASDCPASTVQVVVVVWAGGVTPGPEETDASHLEIYRVATEAGSSRPFALGDLGDGDNYVQLCLDTASKATEVSASVGVLVDPRGDLNPETSVEVAR